MRRFLIPAAIILLIGAIFLVARPKFRNGRPDRNTTSDPASNSSKGSTTFPRDSTLPSRTKSKDRIVPRQPTLEETDDLLRNTIIPLVEIEDLSVGDATDQIRILIRDAGIKPEELRIVCNLPAPYLQLRIREMKLSNVSIAEIFKSISSKTILIFGVGPGVLEFNIPSNIPSQQFRSTPNDPFSGTSQEEGPDPFAEP